jgi:hydrogenase maturation protein HypF
VSALEGEGSVNSVDAISADSSVRLRVRVEGIVQGVGFRPHVYRLARELHLGGYVLNDERGVLLEVEGPPAVAERFLERLVAEEPPLASIERVLRETIPATGKSIFELLPSANSGTPEALISPDTATCAECLAELNDPCDRRYRYPFINCTNCGPRFTITTGIPYDRPSTTMAGFAMCELCRTEYEDPGNRRFHAQPNACPVCGPRALLLWPDGTERVGARGRNGRECAARPIPEDAIRTAARALLEGLIVAVKGLGGYHLACRADRPQAVEALRERKHREDRPFALMAPTTAAVEALVELNEASREMLEDRARPIVVAPMHAHAEVAHAVAPGSGELGVMLPYTPLHHLLMADYMAAATDAAPTTGIAAVRAAPNIAVTAADAVADRASACAVSDGLAALVMTSGNVSDEPIAYTDEDAIARLAGIADVFLVHDRPIHTRTDDSVVRATSMGAPMLMRRSRGYVPGPIGLPLLAQRPVLACGAELKSTFCLARGERAWVSHHIGDLKNYETLQSFAEGVEHFQRLFAISPEIVAHDLHPDYLSTGYAIKRAAVAEEIGDRSEPRPAVPLLTGVQHHHAHMAACLAEHGELGQAVGAVFDGSGYGTDGTVWGGELLIGDLHDFERVGHLRAVRLPGGDRAVHEPWRMACAWLAETVDGQEAPPLPGSLAGDVAQERWETIARLARNELAPVTTSVGRLFDAIAALCGVRASVTYEGQAAIELESAVDRSERGEYTISLQSREGALELDPLAAVTAVVHEQREGAPVGVMAARFHTGLARATARACEQIARDRGLRTVVLSGGVFQNRVLLELTVAELERAGLSALAPELLPAGDGGISYGQAAVAAARLS